jgi:hypothetical protein
VIYAARVIYIPDHRSGRSIEDWFADHYLNRPQVESSVDFGTRDHFMTTD